MNHKTIAVAAIAALVAAVGVFAPGAQAQDLTDLYFVHGVNADGQTDPADGGNEVTVCADGADLIESLSFGQVDGPYPFASGTPVNLVVYAGDMVDCAAPGGAEELVNDDLTPSGTALALVITAPDDGGDPAPELTPFSLDLECSDPGEGRITVAHASGDTPTVEVLVDDVSEGSIDFGETLFSTQEAGTVSIQVDDTGGTVAGPVDVDFTAQTARMLYLVGNVAEATATPTLLITQELDIEACATPTTTTTTTTTTTVVPTTAVPRSTATPLAFTG